MFGSCDGCRIRDETIKELRDQLREAHQTSLAVIDAKAYVLRYQADRGTRPEPSKAFEAPASSPGDFRRRSFQAPLSSEEIEAQFAAEREEKQEQAQASVSTSSPLRIIP